MSTIQYEKIKNNPEFHELIKRRSQFAWRLSFIVLAMYFSFILSIAFKPELLAQTFLPGSIITLGIPIGILIIIISILLTGIYVRKANKEFDQITRKLVEEVQK